MAQKAVLVVLQTLLFVVLFAVGSFLPAVSPSVPTWQVVTGPGRAFVFDGLLLALLAYVLILGLEAARRAVRGPGALTTLSFVLALALGFAMKLGFRST